MKKIILCLICFTFYFTHAKVDPSIDWKKIETPHFEVVFNEKHTPLAIRYAEYAEIAYEYLVPIFKEAPKKTVLIINDSTDQANGYASFLPYPHMMIYPTLPLPNQSISHFDKWGLGLIIHEYAHILSFQPSNGLYTPFKYIFGNIIRPLALLPRWYLEGLAVAMETKFTTMGRLRSTDTQAAIRAFIRDKKLTKMTVDKINEGDNTWPYGRAPYLFGSLVWQKAIDEKGVGIVNSLLQKSSRKFPWTLNNTFKSFYDTNLQSFLHEMYKESIENYKAKPNFGTPHPLAKEHRIIDFAISPDKKKMITLQTSPHEGTRILLHERNKKADFDFKEFKVLVNTRHTQRIGWFNDSNTIYYDKIDKENKRYHNNFKLYTYNIKDQKQKLIPTTARDFQPHLSDSNSKITYIKNGPARNYLYIANVDGSQEVSLYLPELEVRLSYPTFINDNEIIFIERSLAGEQMLKKIDISSKAVESVNTNIKAISKIKRQRSNYLFISEHNGTKNIYSSKYPFYETTALTDSDTAANNGVWDPVVSKLYIAQLTSLGNQLYSLNKSQISNNKNIKPADKVVNYKWPSQFVDPPKVSIDNKVKKYSPWKYMLPRYWIPYAYNVNDGFVFQGSTTAMDPLAQHGLALSMSYDTITEEPSYSAAYFNSTTFADVSAVYGVFHEPLSGTENYYKQTTGGMNFSFFLPGLSNSWRGTFNGKYLSTEQRLFPEEKTELAGPGASINYGKASEYGHKLKSGVINFSLSHNHYIDHKDYLGIDFTKMNFIYNFNHFLPEQHYLIFKLTAAIADNLEDNDQQSNNDVITYGVKTIGGNFIGNLVNSNILMRGYSSGAFTGKQLAVGSLAYDFPVIKSIYKGAGTGPLFFKAINANIFTDVIGLKGRFLFNPDTGNQTNSTTTNYTYEKTNWDKVFVGSGAEVRLSTTISYHLPIDFIIGGYYGFDLEATGGFSTFMTLSIGGFGPLGKKKNKMQSLLY